MPKKVRQSACNISTLARLGKVEYKVRLGRHANDIMMLGAATPREGGDDQFIGDIIDQALSLGMREEEREAIVNFNGRAW